MQKNKVKILFYTGKLIARTWIINIPAVFILIVLMATHQLNWFSALISLLCFWGFSAIIIALIFKDLDKFIAYLNTMASDLNTKFPQFQKSLFSSKRLANAFQAVCAVWQQQANSDTYILKNLPDPIIMLDQNGVIVFLNTQAQQTFQNLSLGISILNLFPKNTLQQFMNRKTHLFQLQLHQHYYQVRSDQLPNPTRFGATIVLLFHDVSLFHQLQQQQRDFFANASHEFKTPLAVMSGAIETLQDAAKSDPIAQQHFLDLIAQQNQHMTQLVEQLLTLTRSTQTQAQPQKINLILWMNKVIQNFLPTAQQKNQHIVIQHPKKTITTYLDPNDLYHIIQNLLDNAIKYGHKNSDIIIKIQRQKKLTLSITNQGPKIQNPHRIFERFYREDTPIKGSGLGLSIVQRLVQKNHGQIHLKSTHQQTTFRIELPIFDTKVRSKHPTFRVVSGPVNVPPDV